MITKSNIVFVFDLDDTLYKEIDFLKSAYKEISLFVSKKTGFSQHETVYKIGLITDGRSVQQRNKLKALGITDFFDEIIISEEFGTEKPNVKNFNFYFDKFGDNYKYVYIADNTSKDFIAPNALNWISICLMDNGENIHKQSFNLETKLKPSFVINSLKHIPEILNKIE